MIKLNEYYKCSVCGNVVSVVEAGGGVLVCCGKEMQLLEEKTAESEGKEKHVPVVTVSEGKVAVNVGSVDHPMEEKHFIETIEVVKDGVIVGRKSLVPGDKPQAEFCLGDSSGLVVRAYCNLHGLWKSG